MAALPLVVAGAEQAQKRWPEACNKPRGPFLCVSVSVSLFVYASLTRPVCDTAGLVKAQLLQ